MGNQCTKYDAQTPKDADEATRRLRYSKRPRRKGALYGQKSIVEQDRAIQLSLSKNAKSDGTISEKTKEAVLLGAYHYLTFTRLPITKDTIHNIINAKCDNPKAEP
jgi:hypothetical protein